MFKKWERTEVKNRNAKKMVSMIINNTQLADYYSF